MTEQARKRVDGMSSEWLCKQCAKDLKVYVQWAGNNNPDKDSATIPCESCGQILFTSLVTLRKES
jgi:uncharacterized Zn finger protein